MATRIEKTDLARDALYDKVNVMIDEVNTKIDNKDSLPSQTGNTGKFLTTDGTNASWGTVNVDTSDIYNKIDSKQDKSTAVNYDNISNCITYMPPDIKLELNNGTLTLKAGSKVYIPNGFESDGTTKKFDVKIIESDLTVTFDTTEQKCVFISPDNTMVHSIIPRILSLPVAPPVIPCYWYDLTNNQIKWTNDGSTWISGYSLPICIATGTNGSVTSIDQVFNGFGYIGSTVFALPGVKGLIPNGRKADGNLKSIEAVTNNVITIDFIMGKIDNGKIYISGEGGIFNNFVGPKKQFYNEQKNIIDFNGTQTYWCECISVINSKFTLKTVFHALDYNDKSIISGWSMPSSRYIDLTLGASGSTYTAPANGYFLVYKQSTAINQYITMSNLGSGGLGFTHFSASSGNMLKSFLPVKNGQKIEITYTLDGAARKFRFIYAEGE